MLWRWILFGLCMVSALMFMAGMELEDTEPEVGRAFCRISFSYISVIVGLIVTQIINF